jgi:hypothetical protein
VNLFAITRPFIPPEHPMHDYANYIVGVTDAILGMLLVVAFLLAGVAVAFLVFAVQKYYDRNEDRRRRLSMDAAVAVLKGLATVLDTIKANMERQLHHATGELKGEIQKTPESTARKVVDEIEERKLSESGVMRQTPKGAP